MLNFLFTIDNGYVEPIKLVIFSIEYNNRNEDKCYYFIYRNITISNQKIIKEFVNKYNSQVVFIPFQMSDPIEFGKEGGWTEETYFRIFAPYLLKEVDTVIYLDGDTIVNTNITGTLMRGDFDISSYALAAVPNDIEDENIERLGMSNTSRYYNAGVLFMNLNNMRNMYSETEIVELLRKLKPILTFRDQDFINIIYEKHILTLPREYNYMINVTERDRSYSKLSYYYICHFVLSKPWNNEFPFRTDYRYLWYVAKMGEVKKALHLWYHHRKFRIYNALSNFRYFKR